MNIKDVCVGIDVNVEIGKSYITLWFYSSDIGQSSNGNAWLNSFLRLLKIISQSPSKLFLPANQNYFVEPYKFVITSEFEQSLFSDIFPPFTCHIIIEPIMVRN